MSQATSKITTIKISKAVVQRLNKLKIHPRQSYEEVIIKLLEENNDDR
jgi:predicted CopG family antitoxin